jgi:hypothetical protein
MKLLICGDRNWTDFEMIESWLERFLETHDSRDITVIRGGARGADSISGAVAAKHDCQVVVAPADWDSFGLAGGPIRNQQMLKLKPDLVVAFYDDIQQSKDTRDMVMAAQKAKVNTLVIRHKDNQW